MIVIYTTLDTIRERQWAQKPVAGLPPAYRERVSAMQSDGARARTCAGIALLAHGLELLHGDRSALNRVGFDANGRPTLAAGPSFSISHSRQWVACALSDAHRVGLDIEQRRDGISPSLVQRMTEGLTPADDLDFFDAWCAREATVKASGRVGLARIRAVQLSAHQAMLDDHAWSLWRPDISPELAACVASDQPVQAGRTVAINPNPAE